MQVVDGQISCPKCTGFGVSEMLDMISTCAERTDWRTDWKFAHMHATVEHDRACAAGHGARQTRVVLQQACLNASEASLRRGTHVDIASTERKEEFGQCRSGLDPATRSFTGFCRLV